MVSVFFYLLSIIAGVLPTVAYVLLIWWIDRYEKEPIKLLVAAFLWGAVPAILASVLIEVMLDVPLGALSGDWHGFLSASLVAPPIEEAFKGAALLGVYSLARQEFDGVLDGIIYGSIIGFGFAMTENIFYFWSAQEGNDVLHWATVVFGRALAFGLNHAMFTSFTGIGLGLARYVRSPLRRWATILLSLTAATVAHMLHNAFASSGLCLVSFVLDWAGVLVILVVIVLTWRRERMWLTTQLAAEVEAGVLTQAQYDVIVSRRRRIIREWRALGSSGVRRARLWGKLTSAATELAFKKHQRAAVNDGAAHDSAIAALRHRILEISARLGES